MQRFPDPAPPAMWDYEGGTITCTDCGAFTVAPPLVVEYTDLDGTPLFDELCGACYAEWSRAYRAFQAHGQRIRARLAGRCADCGAPAHPDMGRFCWTCGVLYLGL